MQPGEDRLFNRLGEIHNHWSEGTPQTDVSRTWTVIGTFPVLSHSCTSDIIWSFSPVLMPNFQMEIKVVLERLRIHGAWSLVWSFQSVIIWGPCHLMVCVHFFSDVHGLRSQLLVYILLHFMLPLLTGFMKILNWFSAGLGIWLHRKRKRKLV